MIRPWLMLVTDRTLCRGRHLADLVNAAIDGGVTHVQVREKDLPARDLYTLARRLRDVTAGRAALFVNERVDVALAIEADGVHLGGGALPVPIVRSLVGNGRLIGRAVHSPGEALAAAEEGADCVLLGTIFQTRSHPGARTGGLDAIRAARRGVAVPLIAIGGITPENAGSVVAAGADGIAVISSILGSRDPAAAAARLVAAIGSPAPIGGSAR